MFEADGDLVAGGDDLSGVSRNRRWMTSRVAAWQKRIAWRRLILLAEP